MYNIFENWRRTIWISIILRFMHSKTDLNWFLHVWTRDRNWEAIFVLFFLFYFITSEKITFLSPYRCTCINIHLWLSKASRPWFQWTFYVMATGDINMHSTFVCYIIHCLSRSWYCTLWIEKTDFLLSWRLETSMLCYATISHHVVLDYFKFLNDLYSGGSFCFYLWWNL